MQVHATRDVDLVITSAEVLDVLAAKNLDLMAVAPAGIAAMLRPERTPSGCLRSCDSEYRDDAQVCVYFMCWCTCIEFAWTYACLWSFCIATGRTLAALSCSLPFIRIARGHDMATHVDAYQPWHAPLAGIDAMSFEETQTAPALGGKVCARYSPCP
jgi:hypothetical protein